MKNNYLIFLIALIFLVTTEMYSQINAPPSGLDRYKFPIFSTPSGYVPEKMAITEQAFTLTLRDGVILDCSRFFPTNRVPGLPGGYPCVIMCHGYGDSKKVLRAEARAQAKYGYAVYTFSMRGQGFSGGLSNLISTTEADDLIELVRYAKADTIPFLDTNKMLIMGGSQGGIIPMMALTRGLKVGSICSSVASPTFATSWIENGCIKMTYLWTITYDTSIARYTNEVKAIAKWLYQSGTKNDKWDSIAYYTPKNRDFPDKVHLITTPIYVENTWQDYFFNALGNIQALQFFPANHMTYFGAVAGHGGDTSYTENQWTNQFYDDWFSYFEDGVDNGLFTKRKKYNFAYTTYPRVNNMWTFIHDSSAVFPPPGFTNTKFYFAANNHLNPIIINSPIKEVAFNNNVIDKNITMKFAVDNAFTGKAFNSKFKKDSVYFETDPLTSTVKMLGIPKFTLKYRSDANICQYNLQISEVKSTGEVNMVTRINYTDRRYVTNTNKTAIINGIAHGHIFQKGSKIRIVVTNLDTHFQDKLFLSTNPFVLPVLVKSHNIIILNSSFIELPLSVSTTNTISYLAKKNVENKNLNLYQNSPNPFNPSTLIRFSLPEGFSGNVSLKIYDITGREIQSLINGTMQQGVYETVWNASEYASGIYFYKLTAGNFTEIKKLILMK